MPVIAVGSEIIECVRIARMIETHGEQFLERVYRSGEIQQCLGSKNATQNFAKRWAAKEAVIRMLRARRAGGLRWLDIEVVMLAGIGPTVELLGTAEMAACRLGIEHIHLSMAACRTHATAHVVAEGEMIDTQDLD
ncbi:MAG: holo-ACP synthase [Planctomycetota bacterium]